MANSNGASAGITFQLTEEQKMIRKLARDFARNEIAPHAEYFDKTHEYPWDIVRKSQELGLTEQYGGGGTLCTIRGPCKSGHGPIVPVPAQGQRAGGFLEGARGGGGPLIVPNPTRRDQV